MQTRLTGPLGELVLGLTRFAAASRDLVVVHLRFKRKRRREAFDRMGQFMAIRGKIILKNPNFPTFSMYQDNSP